jgi:hypothetical protein
VIRLIGLYRETEYSPGRHRSNDTQLLEAVGAVLRRHGLHVELMTIDRAAGARDDDATLFSMCQGRAALDRLADWEIEGTIVVNRPAAALNTYRDQLPALMERAGIPFPQTTLVATGLLPQVDLNGGLWLKRGDVHASVSADVQWIDSVDRLRSSLREFASRGIACAGLQPHVDGEEIKFYGVTGGQFFHWFYPNTAVPHHPLSVLALRHLCEAAAGAAGLEIFGGDVIVGPTGELTLIDLNDWPSFAPCREAAAQAIAHYLMRRVDASWNRGLVPSANQGAL